MAATLILGAEARLAKTDAALLATILAAQWVLARLWLLAETERRPVLPLWQVAVFWMAMAAAVLIKGPIGPMVLALTAAALALVERRAGWLLALRPLAGLALLLVLVVPWYAAITIRTDGAFWEASLGRDLLGKVAEGQESKGAPPGTYLIAFWLTFWPSSLILALALPALAVMRRNRAVVFCLAWAIPVWLVFEAVTTKLLHYTMVAYPALAILAAMGLAASPAPLAGWWRKVVTVLLLAVPVAALGALAVTSARLGSEPGWSYAAGFAIWLVAAIALWQALAARRPGPAVAAVAGLSLALAVALYPGAARIGALWPSAQMGAVRAEFEGCAAPVVVSAGYREPSVVFALGREVRLADGAGAAQILTETPCALVFVEDGERAAFDAAAPEAVPEGRIEGYNLGSGRRIELTVFARRP